MHLLNIQCFRWAIINGKIQIRVMDIIGIFIGIGFIVSWFLTFTNWIIGDIICLASLLAIIKLIKFGSLRMAIIFFIVSTIVNIIFIVMA